MIQDIADRQILLHNSRDIIPSGLAERYINGLSLLLATMYMSKRPYLYITQLDHLLDQTTLEYSMVTGEGVDPGALGTLSAVGNFANGIGIAAAVGSRTLVSSRPLQWRQRLIIPVARRPPLYVLYPNLDSSATFPDCDCPGLGIWHRCSTRMRKLRE